MRVFTIHDEFIEGPSGPIRALVAGAGPPLLLLHGSADSPSSWRGVIEACAAERRCIAPYLEDLGGSAPPGAALEADLPALRDVLGRLGPVEIAAHSYGALLALRAAIGGALVTALTLCEPIAFGLLADRGPIDRLNEGFFGALERGAISAAMGGLVDYWNGAGAFAALPESAQVRLRACWRRTAAEVDSGRRDATSLVELAMIGVPTTLLAGSATTGEALAICRTLAATIPGATLQLIPGAGHQVPRTHPRPVASAIRAVGA